MPHFTYAPHHEGITRHGHQGDPIADAYAACHVTEPDYMGSLEATFEALPTQETAWSAIADLAIDGSADDFLASARDELDRADIAQRLRQRRDQIRSSVQANAEPMRRLQARERLAPEFEKAATALADASRELDRHAPFDARRVLAQNTSKHFNAATDALAVLSALAVLDRPNVDASSTHYIMDTEARGQREAASALASIVKLPAVGFTDHFGSVIDKNYPRSTPLPGNAIVEALCDAMANDPDRALLSVARGDFHGVSLAWQDSRQAFATALASRTVPSGSLVLG